MGWPPDDYGLDEDKDLPAWEVLLWVVVIVGIACVWLWSIEYTKEQALASVVHPPPVVCPKALEPDAVCPGWLFGSDLEDAKTRICRSPR